MDKVLSQRKGKSKHDKESASDHMTVFEVQKVTFKKYSNEKVRSTSLPRTTSSKFDLIVFWSAVGLSETVGATAIGLLIYWGHLNGGFVWSDANNQFNYHPLFMALGLIFFYGNSIIIYRVLYFLPKKLLKIIHGGLHALAIVFSSVGLVAIFENHRRTGKADLYSLHSWIGIATFGFFILQFIGGFVTFLYPGLPAIYRAKALPFHVFFGVGLFALAVGTAQMGLTEKLIWTNKYTEGVFVTPGVVGNCIGVFLILFALVIVFITTNVAFKRKPLTGEAPHAEVN